MADAEKGTSETLSAPPEQPPKVTKDEQHFVVSFIQHLRQKVSKNDATAEQAEAIEVAVQCLEGAFALTDKNYAYQPSKALFDTFVKEEGTSSNEEEEFPKPTSEDIEKANKLKEEGNELVKASQFDEAIIKYNEAIKLSRDPIFFCNRAAAYCRLEQHDLAIQDCRTALALDSTYAKAYGRMAVALSCQHRYDQAVTAYEHALELDPTNESYKSNMALAQEKQREAEQAGNAGQGAAGGFPGFPGIGAMGGLGNMLNNPQMAAMAQQMMTDPNVQNMMSQMMGAFGGQSGPGLDGLMRVGEQIAESLHQSNPQLVEQLRQQFNSARGPSGENDGSNSEDPSQQPPPSN